MPLQALTAQPHPDGHRIDLSWSLPPDAAYAGVRLLRKSGSHPRDPGDGLMLAEADGLSEFSDTGLSDNQFYYYTLFPYRGSPPSYEVDPANRVSALATAPQGFPALMHALVPEIYHRYDRPRQLLARLLALLGGQLDLFYSYARAQRELQRIDHTDGRHLPLLAQWIGWKTDYRDEYDAQREAIRNAPALYQATGLVPTLEATIKRVSGWESRCKEYVHNVFASNRPERLNLWFTREVGGAFADEEQLFSLDYAYDGSCSHARDAHGVRWLVYHTQRSGRWELWYKSSPCQRLPLSALPLLAPGLLGSELRALAQQAGIVWSQAATAAVEGHGVRVTDGPESYFVERFQQELKVFHTSAPEDAFAPSEPLSGALPVQKNPSAAVLGAELWLFWEFWDEASGRYGLRYRVRAGGAWSGVAPSALDPALATNPFASAGTYDEAIARRRAVAVGTATGLWLFWLARTARGWRIFYNLRAGAAWGEPVALPELGDEAATIDDLALALDQTQERIHLLWSQPEMTAGGVVRWAIRQRVKQDLTLDAGGWTAGASLPRAGGGDYHDREPHPHLRADGELELYFASSREDAGFSIWRSQLVDPLLGSWGSAVRLGGGEYSQRAPLVLGSGVQRLLLYRSNRARLHRSQLYRSSEPRDDRYAGSLFADARHAQRIALRGTFEDSQRYSYDTGANGVRDDADRVARDTVGAFVESDTLSPEQLATGVARLRPALQEFVPATDRVVFQTERRLHVERIYHYGLPLSSESRFIVESVVDQWSGAVSEPAFLEGEDFSDELG